MICVEDKAVLMRYVALIGFGALLKKGGSVASRDVRIWSRRNNISSELMEHERLILFAVR